MILNITHYILFTQGIKDDLTKFEVTFFQERILMFLFSGKEGTRVNVEF